MPFVITALAVLALICLLNLALTVGVIRRLREHTLLLGRNGSVDSGTPAPGQAIADFSTTTVDGDTLDRTALADATLVGFFSPGCQPCAELRPAFIEYAVGLPRARVIAVVNGEAGTGADEVRTLSAIARVVVEQPGAEPMSDAFGVRSYPVLCTVDGRGQITGSGRTLTALLASAGV